MRLYTSWLILTAGALFIGCSSDPPDNNASGGAGGAPPSGSPTSSSTSPSASSSTSASSSSASSSGSGMTSCPDAKEVIGAVDKVSTGQVGDLSTTPEEKVLYIDASAGGAIGQPTNPWIYVSLSKAARVDVTDISEFSSMEWDIAMKRSAIRVNDVDSGPGKAEAVFLEGRDYAGVMSADATSATLKTESWFSEPCNPIYDPESGRLVTTFTGWYDYNIMNHTLKPHPGTFIVRDVGGALYKLAILDFYSTPDGGTDMNVLGRYKIKYTKLSP